MAGSILSGIMLAVIWQIIFVVLRTSVVFISFVNLPGLSISILGGGLEGAKNVPGEPPVFFSLGELREAITEFFVAKGYRVNIDIDKYYP